MIKYLENKRNEFINGDSNVWQRGVSQTSSGYGSDDRFENLVSGATRTHSRQELDTPMYHAKYFSRTSITDAGTNSSFVCKRQKVEDVYKSDDILKTLSFSARGPVGNKVVVECSQSLGSDSTETFFYAGDITLTSSWQRYYLLIYFPVLEGVLGTLNNDYYSVAFWLSAGSDYDARLSLGLQTGDFDLACLQIESSEEVSEFEYISLEDQVRHCRRYFMSSFYPDMAIGASDNKANTPKNASYYKAYINHMATALNPVVMRAIPTATVYNCNGNPGYCTIWEEGATPGGGGTGACYGHHNRVSIKTTNKPPISVNKFTLGHYVLDAEL